MNETALSVKLRVFMDSQDGWGRDQGREVYRKMLDFVEQNPGIHMFRISFDGVRRTDISFASETVVELAKRYRGNKGFALESLTDADMLENWEAAAQRKQQPITIWTNKGPKIIGPEPSKGTAAALDFALKRKATKAAEFVSAMPEVTIANASTKFKQLAEGGYLLRREVAAESGGIEYVYCRIG